MGNSTIKVEHASKEQLNEISLTFQNIVNNLTYYNDLAKANELQKYSEFELIKKIEEDPLSVLVAHENQNILGYCFNRFDDYLIWLEWIVVMPNLQRMQVGEKIINNLVSAALKRDCHKIWCDSRTSNQKSINFLLKNGFQKIAIVENHWYGQDFILWQKILK